jgi:phospholipase C
VTRPRGRAAASALAAALAMPATAWSLTPIHHVIFIMQENRSFDHYFGTYPGADGFRKHTCEPIDPTDLSQGCVLPFHDQNDINAGGPHAAADAQYDLDNGIGFTKFDGFVQRQIIGSERSCAVVPRRPSTCAGVKPGVTIHDVMGYHTADEIPNYWAYAQHFVLQDKLFEGVRSYSLPAHLDMTSEWSARCTNPASVATCVTTPSPLRPSGTTVIYPWVNLFQLMDLHQVSWKYYLAVGTEPDCEDDEMTCEPAIQANGVLSFWNPVPAFGSVEAQGASYLAAHNPRLDQFLLDIKNGTLPQVSWIVPSNDYSEHPPAGVTIGMEYVTSLVNAVMQSPYWKDTAIFVSWDDWGGFYDHVVPPIVDRNGTATPIQGFGLRVPGLTISAWARAGMIDHQVLSFDSYATFIENIFMEGARLDPTALGEPDSRPTIRDELTTGTYPDGTTAKIGHLYKEFDFTQTALPPLVLSTHIPPSITVACGSAVTGNPQDCTTNTVTITWNTVVSAMVPGPFSYQLLRDGVAVANCLTGGVTCTDSGVSSGQHYYRVYSIDSTNVASPPSAAAEADVP